MARGVNTLLTSRRYRVWSGGSTASIDGGSTGLAAAPSTVAAKIRRTSGLGRKLPVPTPNAGDRSTSVHTAWLTVDREILPRTISPADRNCS
jgi:hypothetical protein